MVLNRAKGQKREEVKDAQAWGEDRKIERRRYEENVNLMRSSRWADKMGLKPEEKRQPFTNLTIWQSLLMDPCDDDDTAASTADVLPVSGMEWLQLCYSDMDAFLHVDLFHPRTANHRPLELYLHVDVALHHAVRRKKK